MWSKSKWNRQLCLKWYQAKLIVPLQTVGCGRPAETTDSGSSVATEMNSLLTVQYVLCSQTGPFLGWPTLKLPRPSSTPPKWLSSDSWRSEEKSARKDSKPRAQISLQTTLKTCPHAQFYDPVYPADMHAANQTWSNKLAKSGTAGSPEIQRSFAPWPGDAARRKNRFHRRRLYFLSPHLWQSGCVEGRRVGKLTHWGEPFGRAPRVRGKMQRSPAGNISAFQVLWDWLQWPRCKQVYTLRERGFTRGERGSRAAGSTREYCIAEARCFRCVNHISSVGLVGTCRVFLWSVNLKIGSPRLMMYCHGNRNRNFLWAKNSTPIPCHISFSFLFMVRKKTSCSFKIYKIMRVYSRRPKTSGGEV